MWRPAGPPDTAEALERAVAGDREALGAALEKHRLRLWRMVRLRMDRRLQARMDASDVVQEVFLEASRRLEEYLRDRPMPFFLWLRFLTDQRIVALHRFHLGAQARDARREVVLRRRALLDSTSAALAEQIAASGPSPSQGAARGEVEERVRRALAALDPDDREVLALRHFEQLSNAEAAQSLGIEPSAASKRYVRALGRLREVLESMGVRLPESGR